ncbi:MAG: alpha-glucan family phosphorylase [Bacteroidales bacterium]|nr:alpha-glucan family phosphorylase [Bacteroidales bacterium]
MKPDYLFETSWEICNKVGGIYTVLSTKANRLVEQFGDNYILIGPDVWKETRENPDFIEDNTIYRSWREKAESEGLNLRIGRWNTEGRPVVVLVDFTPYFSKKNEIFAEYWDKYKLDSLTGQWDYIEPALFGYAAAQLIESFYEFHLTAQDRIVAQFHEWMTGMGVLYLKDKVPQVGCAFTTHATVLGRTISSNNMPLYSELENYDGLTMAKKLNVLAKYSLESTAARETDVFTTVSELTAKECKQFLNRDVDLVTPNGFDDSFVPDEKVFNNKREKARAKLLQVASALTNTEIPGNAQLTINSGRYEFFNKGIDLYIESLAKLNQSPDLKTPVVGFITVPTNHLGPKTDLLKRLEIKPEGDAITNAFLTHELHDPDVDPILKKIKDSGLHNQPDDKVKIIFVPSYLDGGDGVFDMDYYDLLIGMDVSAFPSYYEPWGYTPLESLAFSIPTVTTSLAGFGIWVNSHVDEPDNGIRIIERTDHNHGEVAEAITKFMVEYNLMDKKAREKARKKAFEISRIALWKNFLHHYDEAYSKALQKVEDRFHLFKDKQVSEPGYYEQKLRPTQPHWKHIYIESSIPERFASLRDISKNLWWSWNYEARELFEMIDPELWEKTGHNPVVLLEELTYAQWKKLERDEDFVAKFDRVSKQFFDYLEKGKEKQAPKIAYFSMEYGLHDIIKIYSGGLGMLAGDYLKEASDVNVDMIGVGLLYHYGYFVQSISLFGDQISNTHKQNFSELPLHPVRDKSNEWVRISIALPGRNLYARVWRVDIGRIPLYLLDTDISDNQPQDRQVTHQLYGGDWDNRFKQELLLGIGGIRMLDTLGINPDLFHSNEGHSAFIGIERLRKLIHQKKFSFEQSVEIIRASTLFTTHTPVPAGHDEFSEDMIRAYIPHYADRLNISWEGFMDLGRYHEGNTEEHFSMSVLAAKLSQEVNGVSQIHGKVSRDMFNKLYEGYFPDELHIGYVTNGVHYPTWAAKEWQQLFREQFGDGFLDEQDNPSHWEKIQKVSSEKIWELRKQMKKRFIDYLKERLTNDMTLREENPKIIFRIMESIDENALTIGFARRFATYKRAHLLFSNLERLAEIVNNEERPVQFIFAGKAHPHDQAGQGLIKKIIEVSKKPEFQGRIIFVENYDIALAKMLLTGVDIWLNTPTRPLEASGTSGEKGLFNGILNFSVLDGWWAEGYKPEAGWAIQEARTYANQQFQDALDAETIYSILEDEIVPQFYERDKRDIPVRWTEFIKNSIAGIAPHYTTRRMLNDYISFYYNKLYKRSQELEANNYALSRHISAWKRKVMREWDNIEVVSVDVPYSVRRPLSLGEKFNAGVKLDIANLNPEDIGIEVIFGNKKQDSEEHEIIHQEELKQSNVEGSVVTFTCEIPTTRSGMYDYVFRVFPKNKHLPHRQDFGLVKWV